MAQILILHGPNLNLLGVREPAVYGYTTLTHINQQLESQAKQLGHSIVTLQSNAEHELVTAIQLAKPRQIQFIIINPAAYGHTSIALRDAFLAVGIPFIEVHLSNPYAREAFRHHSYLADLAKGIICGFGTQSYYLALQAAHHILTSGE